MRKRPDVKAFRLVAVAALGGLVGCGGSGASVPAVSELTEARDAPAVEGSEPATPVERPSDEIRFVCQTSQPFYDGEVHVIRFALRGETIAEAILVAPENSLLAPLDEGRLVVVANGKLTIRGAGRTELSLFDNSNRTRGYVKADGHYAEIYCEKD